MNQEQQNFDLLIVYTHSIMIAIADGCGMQYVACSRMLCAVGYDLKRTQ